MNLKFDIKIAEQYHSNSQKARVMSEKWMEDNMYCPCCGNSRLSKLPNNKPVADFMCKKCNEFFELKSKRGKNGKKIADGAYSTMIDRITDTANPELFVLQYSPQYYVTDLMLIPKFFFVPDIIEKRKPLPPTARRSGWIGCNIIYSGIPEQGKILIVSNGEAADKNEIVDSYNRIKSLQVSNIESRGWLLDILNCINIIKTDEFYLNDVYEFADILQSKHPNNNNIKAKIRQQLQILRDKGFIIFLGNGHYRKI